MALPTIAVAWRAAALLLLLKGSRLAVQQLIKISWRLGPQQQTHSSGKMG